VGWNGVVPGVCAGKARGIGWADNPDMSGGVGRLAVLYSTANVTPAWLATPPSVTVTGTALPLTPAGICALI
jgi:hypothetical protein